MSKLDDIRRMREANFERQQKRAAAVPRGGDQSGLQRKAQPVLVEPVIATVKAAEDDPPGRKRSGVRADWNGYMREYRKRERAELKRLRELVGRNI